MPTTADQILSAIKRHPLLLVEVARQIRVAFPWRGRSRREAVYCNPIATIVKDAQGQFQIAFGIEVLGEPYDHEVYGSREEAKAACDEYLRQAGWIVLN